MPLRSLFQPGLMMARGPVLPGHARPPPRFPMGMGRRVQAGPPSPMLPPNVLGAHMRLNAPTDSEKARSVVLQALQKPDVQSSKRRDSASNAGTSNAGAPLGPPRSQIPQMASVTPEVQKITLYKSEQSRVTGHLIAVNSQFICYALRTNQIRVISQTCDGVRGKLERHAQIADMRFFDGGDRGVDLLASAGDGGIACIWYIVTFDFDAQEICARLPVQVRQQEETSPTSWRKVCITQFVHRFFKPNPFLHDVGLVSSC